MRVKQNGDFKVDTRNAGSGDLKVLVKGPSEYRVAKGIMVSLCSPLACYTPFLRMSDVFKMVISVN